MKPATLDLIIYQGTTFVKPFQWKTGEVPTPVDLTGCTARMHIRRKITDSEILMELSTANSRIVITDAVAGKFEMRLTALETAGITFKNGVFDFEIVYPGGEPVYRIFQGEIEINPEVTR